MFGMLFNFICISNKLLIKERNFVIIIIIINIILEFITVNKGEMYVFSKDNRIIINRFVIGLFHLPKKVLQIYYGNVLRKYLYHILSMRRKLTVTTGKD